MVASFSITLSSAPALFHVEQVLVFGLPQPELRRSRSGGQAFTGRPIYSLRSRGGTMRKTIPGGTHEWTRTTAQSVTVATAALPGEIRVYVLDPQPESHRSRPQAVRLLRGADM